MTPEEVQLIKAIVEQLDASEPPESLRKRASRHRSTQPSSTEKP